VTAILYLSALFYLCCTESVKGIWKSPPPGWPSDIEFVDPNNGLADSGSEKPKKPKKELLVPMMEHLVAKYRVDN